MSVHIRKVFQTITVTHPTNFALVNIALNQLTGGPDGPDSNLESFPDARFFAWQANVRPANVRPANVRSANVLKVITQYVGQKV